MHIAAARSFYRRTESASAPPVDDPHRIVSTTLSELERALRVISAAHSGGSPLPEAQTTRALTAIYILQSSLDFEVGGELAVDLFRVYEYCRQQVLAAMRKAQTTELDNAAQAVAGILAAWRGIAPGAGGGG
ncbi:flagellar protein FliS [Rhodovulum bhavnagarense]|uniref:Flagellar protein FliS n=1 Tax=Rhodovulum bhavnagarense TaxID=992286 RepID=A0A4R2RGY1_9RHOB|nr:flagellar protein FliS [Rhodovulum bhavnagarense]TCP61367.1 flagellar protein FliS [Rhodovulum bhavnagarense]